MEEYYSRNDSYITESVKCNSVTLEKYKCTLRYTNRQRFRHQLPTRLLAFLNKNLDKKVQVEAGKLNSMGIAKNPSGVIKIRPGELKVSVQQLTTTPSIFESTASAALTTCTPAKSTSATAKSTASSAETTTPKLQRTGNTNQANIFLDVNKKP